MEELKEGGSLDVRGEDVRVAEGEGGGADFGGGDGGAFEEPVGVCVGVEEERE